MEYDLLNLPDDVERRRHKLRRTVPAPNSYFMNVKDGGNSEVSMVFSHSQTAIFSGSSKRLATPTGGKVKLTKDCLFKINNKEQDIGGHN